MISKRNTCTHTHTYRERQGHFPSPDFGEYWCPHPTSVPECNIHVHVYKPKQLINSTNL